MSTKKNDNAGECNCLGWCGKRFWSPDKTTIRFCTKCRSKKNSNSDSMSRMEMRASSRTADRELQISDD